jgi:hypothetical protein
MAALGAHEYTIVYPAPSRALCREKIGKAGAGGFIIVRSNLPTCLLANANIVATREDSQAAIPFASISLVTSGMGVDCSPPSLPRPRRRRARGESPGNLVYGPLSVSCTVRHHLDGANRRIVVVGASLMT